jgi:hemolysin activation/secretion protein
MNKGASVTTTNPLRLTPLLRAMCVAALPLALASPAHAQVPGAGTLLQQVQPVKPVLPASSATGLTIEQPGGAQLPASAPFLVKRIAISGNSAIDSATLHALVADAEGKQLTLQALGELAARITAHYRSRGYTLARAFVPAQTIRDGVASIEVMEARYGEVILNNRSRVRDGLLRDAVSALQAGQVVRQGPLEHGLLLASDIPGARVSATLKPGSAVGSSDLVLDADATPPLSGSVTLDNDGGHYTGRSRLGGNLSYNNAHHNGDVLSVSALTSGKGLYYGRLAYDTLINGRGDSVGGSVSALRYLLGAELAGADAHGTARVGSLWGRHPFLRSREANLTGQLQYDRQSLRDAVGTSGIHTDRHLDNWNLSISGDRRDGGGGSTMSLALTSGKVAFDNAIARASDAATANTGGRFSKWNLALARLQRLDAATSLYATVAGQWASTNLDASQKMSAGGPYGVRAYDAGTVTGDAGVSGSIELRRDLGAVAGGRMQAQAFLDGARVKVNQQRWVGVTGENSVSLSGVGVGVNWSDGQHWQARASIARPIGSEPDQTRERASVRAWLAISRMF